MKVKVDAGICAGFGACLGVSPEMFELHDDGYAVVKLADVPVQFEAAVREAVSQCPSGAITLMEESG